MRIFLNMSELDEVLTGIPSQLLPSRVDSAQLIDGGLNNRNVLINESLLIKEFQMRDEKNDPVYHRFKREKDVLNHLKSSFITPQLISSIENPPQLFLAREWIKGCPITAIDLAIHAEVVVKSILNIHQHSKPLSADYDYLDVLRRYLREYNQIIAKEIFSSEEALTLPHYYVINAFCQSKLDKLGPNIKERTLCRIHGDLVFSNIILHSNKPRVSFIDWEYSTLGTPFLDLAYLITQNNIPRTTKDLIINLYFDYSGEGIDRSELVNYSKLMSLMYALWYTIHSSRLKLEETKSSVNQNSGKFLTLAIEQFGSLKLNSSK